jgi:phosphoribosylformylglycinamidine (FGAM) synthase PurS component
MEIKKTTFLVETYYKAELHDPKGAEILARLKSFGALSAKEVRSGSLYEIEGGLASEQIGRIASEFLADPVSQGWRLIPEHPAGQDGLRDNWRVEVWPKDGFRERAGAILTAALRQAGHRTILGVRVGDVYRVAANYHKTQVENAFLRVLVAPRTHSLKVVAEAPWRL